MNVTNSSTATVRDSGGPAPFCSASGGTQFNCSVVQLGGILTIFGDRVDGMDIASGATAYLRRVTGSGSYWWTIAGTAYMDASSPPGLAGAGTIHDDCGNTFVTTGSFSGSWFGSCSTTGAALVTADIALTSGWDTSTKGTISGDSHRGTFTVTLAGTPTSPGVITITFPTAFPPGQTPQCAMLNIGGNNVFPTSIATGTVSGTSAAFTVTTGTLTTGDTMTFQYSCQ